MSKGSYGSAEFIALLEKMGAEVKTDAPQYKTRCPVCGPKSKRRFKQDLSVNMEEGKWFCHNNGCDNYGSVRSHEEETVFNWSPEDVELPEYFAEDFPLGDEVVEWYAERGISEHILEANQVGQGENQNGPYIVWPVIVDGVVVRLKYRSLEDKVFWQSKGQKTFYGLQHLFDENGKLQFKHIYIVEGEPDVHAANQAGFWNVISVPDGAPDPGKAKRLNRKFSYFDNEAILELFESLEEVTLATDNDEPGKFLADELARRIGYKKSYRIQFPEGTKDIGDVLREYGPEKVVEVLNARRRFPVEGVIEVTDILPDILDYYEKGAQPGLSLGYGPQLDEVLTLETGRVNLWTAAPNSGKSAMLRAANINMAKLHGLVSMKYAPEDWPLQKDFRFNAQLYHGVPWGRPNDEVRMTMPQLEEAAQFIQHHVKWLKPQSPSVENILETARQVILRDGAQVLIIDPWNNVFHNYGTMAEYQYISQQLNVIRDFTREYGLITHIVIHPRKLGKDAAGEWDVASAYDLKGASEWFDKADNIFSIRRRILTPGEPVELHIQKGKDNEIVRPGVVALFDFDKATGRYRWLGNEGAIDNFYQPPTEPDDRYTSDGRNRVLNPEFSSYSESGYANYINNKQF